MMRVISSSFVAIPLLLLLASACMVAIVCVLHHRVSPQPATQALVRSLPLSCLVLESDSPALAPAVGQVNQPANVLLACAEVARIKGVPTAEVARATTENAAKLFPRVGSPRDGISLHDNEV